MSNYYDGMNEKLLQALPPARRILELGCANGRLGDHYKLSHPEAEWIGVELDPEAARIAAGRLDRVICANVEDLPTIEFETPFDMIVCGDVLEHLPQPAELLNHLRGIVTRDALLVCCVPNMAHASVVEQLLMGDLTYQSEGLLDATHLRFFTPSSITKLMLDAGLLPNIVDGYFVNPTNPSSKNAMLLASEALGVPKRTAERNLCLYQIILRATFQPYSVRHDSRIDLFVLVPETNEVQLRNNVLSSPGLAEISARIKTITAAGSAAEAYREGVRGERVEWTFFCHQDVYLPASSGFALATALSTVDPEVSPAVGFIGLTYEGAEANAAPRVAGLCVDRTTTLSHPTATDAISIDEFAVAIHKDCPVELDANLGWHLWGTDLCIRLREMGKKVPIVRVPMFHNSLNDYTLPESFHASAAYLKRKHARFSPIHTLCASI